MNLELKKFDISQISDDKVVVLIGKRETGKSFLSTGTASPFWLYTIGIGQPQYLCLDTPQSFNLKFIFFCPNFFFSSISIVLIIESSGTLNPFKKSELIIIPGPV